MLPKRLEVYLDAPSDSHVIHMRTLRTAIGGIALGLPWALMLGENLRDQVLRRAGGADGHWLEASISAYFHTGMREVFVGSLCAIAIFLICYKGYERRDNLAANVAGLSALVVALFPTHERSREAADTGVRPPDSVTLFSDATAPDPSVVGGIHFLAAAIFFVTLAVMSLFLFTRTEAPAPTTQKNQRNRVYKACGIAIILALLLIVAAKLFAEEQLVERWGIVFWLETIAVTAFGVSWLTKAEVILKDARYGGS